MKHHRKLLFLIVLLLSSMSGWAQVNSEVLIQTRELEPFDKVVASNGINVKLYDNQLEEAEITVKGVPLENIITEVIGTTLKVKMKVSVKNKDVSVVVKVSYKNLMEVEAVTGAVIETGRPLTAKELMFKATTGGVIKAEIEAEKVKASASAGSDVQLFGKAGELDASSVLGGSIKAFKLKSKVVKAKASGGSVVEVYAMEEADLSAKFGATLRMKGTPSEIKKSSSTGGEIEIVNTSEYGKDLIRDDK